MEDIIILDDISEVIIGNGLDIDLFMLNDYHGDDYYERLYREYYTDDKDLYDGVLYNDRLIYFYDDVSDKKYCHEFVNLKEFELFCSSHGYHVYGKNYECLMNCNNYRVYCCLSPDDMNCVLCDVSYGSLYWNAYVNIKEDELPY